MKKTITITSRGAAQRLLVSGDVKQMRDACGFAQTFSAEDGLLVNDDGVLRKSTLGPAPWTYSIEVPAEAPKPVDLIVRRSITGKGLDLNAAYPGGGLTCDLHDTLAAAGYKLGDAVQIVPKGADAPAPDEAPQPQHDMRENGTYAPSLGDVSTWKGLINTPPETHEQVLRYGGSDVSFGGHDLNKAVFNNVNFSIREDGKVLVAPKPMRAVSDEAITEAADDLACKRDYFCAGVKWREGIK